MGFSLLLTLPEILLSLAAMLLMMVAAFAGDRAGRIGSWLAAAALIGTIAVVPAVFGGGGAAFEGLFIADSFAAFAKVVIYGSAAVALIAASNWFRRDGDYRTEYPVLIL